VPAGGQRVVMPCGPKDLAAGAASQGVVTDQPDRHTVGDQEQDDQVEQATPSWSADQRAWEKKRCARAWCQACSKRAPHSMPVTVCRPGWAQNPQASPQKVVKVGW
jgi:hypothetical protein